MVQLTWHPSKKTGLPHSAFPLPLQCAYAAVATYKGDADLEDRISEADLAKTLGEGVVIRRAVVVLVATTGDYIVYLRLSDRAGYVCLAKRKPTTGPKAWGDFRTLHRTLHKQGYFGGICVFSEGHPVLHRLGISAELPV